MATLVLKSLITGYVLVLLVPILFGVFEGFLTLILPIVLWPATLIVSVLAMIVFIAIKENRKSA